MIEKMKFLSITGPREDFDRVLDQYLSKYDFHLENALSELKNVSDLRPFVEVNPFKDTLNSINLYLNLIDTSTVEDPDPCSMNGVDALLHLLLPQIHEVEEKRTQLTDRRESLLKIQRQLLPFRALEHTMANILDFQFVSKHFGKVAAQYYSNFEKYVDEDENTLFYKCESTPDYIYGVYFVPSTMAAHVEAVYSSLHFEPVDLSSLFTEEIRQDMKEHPVLDAENHPDYFAYIDSQISKIDQEINRTNQQLTNLVNLNKLPLLRAKKRLDIMSSHFEVRKMAAITKEDQSVYFILCGWMTAADAKRFMKESDSDKRIFVVYEDEEVDDFNQAPTKLKNPKIFKPFEMFIRMYGLPATNELDPTIFVALTYTFIFGCMFGDVGQGLVLMIGGFAVYKWRHMDLAAIIGFAGIFSTIFGFLFGSIFGFEDVIPALWLRPVEQMSDLPFVGRLNTVFIIAIAFGMGIILLTMIFNIVNSVHAKSKDVLFDHNGIAGLIFYGAAIAVIVLFMTGNKLPAGIVLLVMFILPLILMALREPLTSLVEKKAKLIEGGKGMFVVQTFFEMFEVLLSYFSNTLSFVRIGAFAVSHAAIMEVVLMLAGAENGAPNWIVIVIGNLVVIGLEGLIVGIQVLRLEYYEMFSRFYRGTGREFKPFLNLKQLHENKK